MKVLKKLKKNHLFTPMLAFLMIIVTAALWGVTYADGNPGVPYTLNHGYLGFTYGETVTADHTATQPQSKLWWHDGYWWATLWHEGQEEYRIYRLNWGTQVWQDTGVALDDRPEARTDVLMDSSTGKLYIASHFKQNNPSSVNGPENWARLYRFTYDEDSGSFVPDPGSPFSGDNGINIDKTNSVVIDKDSSGRLWATYVSRPQDTQSDYQVYFNFSDDDGETWEGPFSLYDIGFNEAFVEVDDLSSVISYDGNLALVWTNQADTNLYFAERVSGMPVDSTDGWDVEAISIPEGIDAHINVKANSAGQIFIAVKTKGDNNGSGPLIGLVTRDTDGSTAFHEYSAAEHNDTRPIMVVDEANNQVYVFVTGKPEGSKICYKTAAITPNLGNMSFAPGDCGTEFIEDEAGTYDNFDSATTSKHNVDATTGLVVLANDDHNGRVYGHNVITIVDDDPQEEEINIYLPAIFRR
ncbi:MAG: hypothetical protein ACOC9Z_02515 [Chloroflexota bacterium]